MNQPRVNRQISDADKTTKVPDTSPFYFKIVKELIWCTLRESNVESSKNTLSFYLKKMLEDHKHLYNSTNSRFGRNNVLKNLVSIHLNILTELWLSELQNE